MKTPHTSRWSALYWWVIAAAFIGPGTVTTAATAGYTYGYALLWSIVFSIFACIVLQEASARLTILTGKPLAELMSTYLGRWTLIMVGLAVGLGCLAYQAGNITGAVEGIHLSLALDRRIVILIVSVLAAVMLWFGSLQWIARVLGGMVLLMGCCFILVALMMEPSFSAILTGMFIPSHPDGSIMTIIALVGTTIVPYNLFLGSGMAKGRAIPEMRTGVASSVLMGGLITMAILISGMSIQSEFSFRNLALSLQGLAGTPFDLLFMLGLFAAGFTSAITAPTAFSMVMASLWPSLSEPAHRWLKMGVVTVGAFFTWVNVKPVALILAAQALNGILLPITALSLAVLMQNAEIRRLPYANGTMATVALWLTVLICGGLGLMALARLFL
jgi:Mn2+/Fe2+ NRAMP family transporter